MKYSEAELDLIFTRANPVPGAPGVARDCDGRIICRSDYGAYSEFGWQVDHIQPIALGGLLGEFLNMRPRHWHGNTSAGGLLGALLSPPMENRSIGMLGVPSGPSDSCGFGRPILGERSPMSALARVLADRRRT